MKLSTWNRDQDSKATSVCASSIKTEAISVSTSSIETDYDVFRDMQGFSAGLLVAYLFCLFVIVSLAWERMRPERQKTPLVDRDYQSKY